MTLVLLYAASGWSTTTSAQDVDPLDNKLVFAVVVNRIFNRGNVALVDDFMAKDVTSNGTPLGRAGFKTLVKDLRTMTPDLKLTVEDVVTQGDRVIGHVTQTGGGASTRRFLLLRIHDGLVQEQWSWPDPELTNPFDGLGSTLLPALPPAPEIPSVIPPGALANLPGLEPSDAGDTAEVVLRGRFNIHGVTREATLPATVVTQPNAIWVRRDLRFTAGATTLGSISRQRS
jgi:predicted SnoaL-like aldol condensation-catalyzing enzyme